MPSSWRGVSLPDPQEVLIAALSGRALAAAARRAGYALRVLDLFRDLDTRRLAVSSRQIAGDVVRGFDAEDLLAAARAEGTTLPLVAGAGFEDRPELLARLSRVRRLLGNPPETVARLKDPRAFAALAESIGVAHPAIRLSPPPEPFGWLAKRVGGSGGWHIRPAAKAGGRKPGTYFQRRVKGRSISAQFLADGRAMRLLGFSTQWPAGRGGSFLFGGALRAAEIEADAAARIDEVLVELVRATGLIGLNSADFLLDGRTLTLLEVNPRPGATLDIFDGGTQPGLFTLHVAACDGRLPSTWQPSGGAAACQILYAPRALEIPAGIRWPRWSADRPAPGTAIGRGEPVCTLLARGRDPDRLRARLNERASAVLRILGVVRATARSNKALETPASAFGG